MAASIYNTLQESQPEKTWCMGLFITLIIVFFCGILSMPREEYIADPMTMRSETVSLLNTGSLEVPAAIAESFGEFGQYFFYNAAKNKYYSKYGILTGLIYLPALAVEKWREGQLPYFSPARVLYLNFFNIFLALCSAIYLYLIASHFTKKVLVVMFFVLSSFYCTYWWNYLRAQNSEIFQTLFMLGFYYHFLRFRQCAFECREFHQRKEVCLAALFLGLLILTKIFYLILLPLAGLFFLIVVRSCDASHANRNSFKSITSNLPALFAFSSPIVIALSFLLFINHYKFGSAFVSGYGQWVKEATIGSFKQNIFVGLRGLLFDPQFNIWLAFPLLLFALWGYKAFFKKYFFETALALAIGLEILLTLSRFAGWRGIWCYGPRYMLSCLPLLSLPFIAVLERLVEQRKKYWALCCGGFVAVVLLVSFNMQLRINALPFFVYFQLYPLESILQDPQLKRYFEKTPFAIINGELLDFKKYGDCQLIEMERRRLSPESLERLKLYIRAQVKSNYYWWPDSK